MVHKAADGNFAVVSILYQYGDADPLLSKVIFFFFDISFWVELALHNLNIIPNQNKEMGILMFIMMVHDCRLRMSWMNWLRKCVQRMKSLIFLSRPWIQSTWRKRPASITDTLVLSPLLHAPRMSPGASSAR